jgi:hypothetical protein
MYKYMYMYIYMHIYIYTYIYTGRVGCLVQKGSDGGGGWHVTFQVTIYIYMYIQGLKQTQFFSLYIQGLKQTQFFSTGGYGGLFHLEYLPQGGEGTSESMTPPPSSQAAAPSPSEPSVSATGIYSIYIRNWYIFYICICMCLCVCVCIYIYTYILSSARTRVRQKFSNVSALVRSSCNMLTFENICQRANSAARTQLYLRTRLCENLSPHEFSPRSHSNLGRGTEGVWRGGQRGIRRRGRFMSRSRQRCMW